MILLRNHRHKSILLSLVLKQTGIQHLVNDLTSYLLSSPSLCSPSGWGSGHIGCSDIHRRSAWWHLWRRNPQPGGGYRRGRKMMPGHRSYTESIWCWKSAKEKSGRTETKTKSINSWEIKSHYSVNWTKRHSQRGHDCEVLNVAGEVCLHQDFGLGQGFVPTATKQCHASIAQQGGHQGGVGHCPNAPDTAIITTWGGIIYQHTGGTHRTYDHTAHLRNAGGSFYPVRELWKQPMSRHENYTNRQESNRRGISQRWQNKSSSSDSQ